PAWGNPWPRRGLECGWVGPGPWGPFERGKAGPSGAVAGSGQRDGLELGSQSTPQTDSRRALGARGMGPGVRRMVLLARGDPETAMAPSRGHGIPLAPSRLG